MIERNTVLDAIRKEATLNGGTPLGKGRFRLQTGIRESDWSGVYWTKWSDAIREAGLVPNEFQSPHNRDAKLKAYLTLTRKLGHIPTISEMRLEKRRDPSFPNSKTLHAERGGRASLIRDAKALCEINTEFSDCIPFIIEAQEAAPHDEGTEPSNIRRGYVYLIRSGKYCKIGITEALYRRAAQIANGTPEGADILHSFMTDDPRGIETYWHSRFATKRVQGANISRGEWFLLDAIDIAAFKMRKQFM